MITSPVPEFEPPSRLEWLAFICLGLSLFALILRGAVACWHDLCAWL